MNLLFRSSARPARVFMVLVVVCLAAGLLDARTASVPRSSATPNGGVGQNGELWLAPADTSAPVTSQLPVAISDLLSGRAARALPVFTSHTSDPLLGGYAMLYVGRAQASLGKWSEAAETAQQLIAREPDGYLGEAALWLAADAAENLGDLKTAVDSLRTITTGVPLVPERAWLRLGRAAERAGDKTLAATAIWKVYYDFPLTFEAEEAALSIGRLPLPAGRTAADRRQLNFTRAQQFFTARRISDARKAFDALRVGATPEEKSAIQFRIAQCDFFLRRFTVARDALRPFTLERSSRQPEAILFFASALRESGRADDYITYARKFASEWDGSFVEEALNDLATFQIVRDDDAAAAAIFGEMYARFPTGAYAERAAWRAGWWAYRNGQMGDAIRVFESAVANLGRVDRRPSFLYWAARARNQRGERELAAAGFRQVVADYRNSYYGRLAQRDLESFGVPVRRGGPYEAAADRRDLPVSVSGGARPANAETIRRLLAVGLYDLAINELRRAQLESGSSPLIEASIAYAMNRRGELRPAISAMRRAYPQFMADGGEALPPQMLAVIFPVTYWDVISAKANEQKLDPYLMTALIAQESTFDARVKSVANAYGLMQILPSTGRRYAPRLGIRPFSTRRLTEPEVNVQIGMAFFSDLVDKFDDRVSLALAAYNAGDSRVSRWMEERRGIDPDEFVDDIPFPETQNYVKRIVGTAEDYRALYKTSLSNLFK